MDIRSILQTFFFLKIKLENSLIIFRSHKKLRKIFFFSFHIFIKFDRTNPPLPKLIEEDVNFWEFLYMDLFFYYFSKEKGDGKLSINSYP